MRLAWGEPGSPFHGKYYTIPPPGILNTGNALKRDARGTRSAWCLGRFAIQITAPG